MDQSQRALIRTYKQTDTQTNSAPFSLIPFYRQEIICSHMESSVTSDYLIMNAPYVKLNEEKENATPKDQLINLDWPSCWAKSLELNPIDTQLHEIHPFPNELKKGDIYYDGSYIAYPL